jgi:hypothetical protein
MALRGQQRTRCALSTGRSAATGDGLARGNRGSARCGRLRVGGGLYQPGLSRDATCLSFTLVAPPALTSNALARRTGLFLGIGSGLGLLLLSRSNTLETGAMTFIVPAQFVIFVIAPVIVAALRSLGAAVQAIVAGFIFGGVTMFPVYILESIRRYKADGGLYLDGDAPMGTTIGTNLGDAISWLLLVVPGLMIPLGILAAALATVVVRAIGRTLRISSHEAAVGSAGIGKTSGS